MLTCIVLLVFCAVVTYAANDGNLDDNGSDRRCSLEKADCVGTEHGCKCTAAFTCDSGLECNRNSNRCFSCPLGEIGCAVSPGDVCLSGLVRVDGKCQVGNSTQTTGQLGEPCFNATVPYAKCSSQTLNCKENRCAACSARPFAELGCACQSHDDCGDGLLCDSGSGTCAACISGCLAECEVGHTVQNSAIAIALTLVGLSAIGLITAFVLQRRRS
jgi:hypothetical protein